MFVKDYDFAPRLHSHTRQKAEQNSYSQYSPLSYTKSTLAHMLFVTKVHASISIDSINLLTLKFQGSSPLVHSFNEVLRRNKLYLRNSTPKVYRWILSLWLTQCQSINLPSEDASDLAKTKPFYPWAVVEITIPDRRSGKPEAPRNHQISAAEWYLSWCRTAVVFREHSCLSRLERLAWNSRHCHKPRVHQPLHRSEGQEDRRQGLRQSLPLQLQLHHKLSFSWWLWAHLRLPKRQWRAVNQPQRRACLMVSLLNWESVVYRRSSRKLKNYKWLPVFSRPETE